LARAGEEPIRAEHSFTWRLSQDDQKQIDEVRSNLTKYREVPKRAVSPRHEAAGEGEIRRALSVPYLKRGNLSLARVENRYADYFFALIPDNYVIIHELAIRGDCGLLEVQIKNIGISIIAGPKLAVRRAKQRRHESKYWPTFAVAIAVLFSKAFEAPRQKRSNDKPILKINFSINYDKRFAFSIIRTAKSSPAFPFNT